MSPLVHVAKSIKDATGALVTAQESGIRLLAGGTWIMRAPVRRQDFAKSYVAIGRLGAAENPGSGRSGSKDRRLRDSRRDRGVLEALPPSSRDFAPRPVIPPIPRCATWPLSAATFALRVSPPRTSHPRSSASTRPSTWRRPPTRDAYPFQSFSRRAQSLACS